MIERVCIVREPTLYEPFRVNGPEEVGEFIRQEWLGEPLKYGSDQENFWVLHLDTAHRVKSLVHATKGCIAASLIDAREVFAAALKIGAKSIILAHCHPGGGLTPSLEDLQVTRKMAAIASMHDIPLLDHVIVTRESEHSIRAADDQNWECAKRGLERFVDHWNG